MITLQILISVLQSHLICIDVVPQLVNSKLGQIQLPNLDIDFNDSIVHFCETKYICRHSLIAHHLSWAEDISNEACGVCDNCLSNICDKPVRNDFSDVIRLLKITKEILISGKFREMVSLDIAAVFCKLKRANEMGLSELSVIINYLNVN